MLQRRSRLLVLVFGSSALLLVWLLFAVKNFPPSTETRPDANDARPGIRLGQLPHSADQRTQPEEASAVAGRGERELDGLLAALTTEVAINGVSEQAEALMAQVAQSGNEAINPLLSLLGSAQSLVTREVAARSLVTIGTESSVAALLQEVTEQWDPVVRERLLRSLQALRSPSALPALMDCVLSRVENDYWLDKAVLNTLPNTVDAQGIAWLSERFYDPQLEQWQQQYLLEAIKLVKDPLAMESLRTLLDPLLDERLGEAAIVALSGMASAESLRELVRLVETGATPSLRSQALAGVAAMDSKDRADELLQLADTTPDAALRENALLAWSRTGSESTE